jgi:hypothetical protein
MREDKREAGELAKQHYRRSTLVSSDDTLIASVEKSWLSEINWNFGRMFLHFHNWQQAKQSPGPA